jgi:hypothetical protein
VRKSHKTARKLQRNQRKIGQEAKGYAAQERKD